MTRTIDYEALEDQYADQASSAPMGKSMKPVNDGGDFKRRAEANRNGAHKRLRQAKGEQF
jgi:hypothetical protein